MTRVRKPRSADLLDAPPPHDLDAERAVLGSMLLDGNAIDKVTPILSAADFHGHGHDTLFSVMAGMHESSEAIDAITLTSYLSDAGKLADIGGHAYLATLAGAVPVAANILHYVGIVKEKSQRRRLRHTALDLLQAATDGKALDEVASLLRETEAELSGRAARGFDLTPLTCAELVEKDLAVDFLVEPILVTRQPILLAGPMKSMKTSLLLDLALSVATGGYFLGRFRVPQPAAVAVLTGESGLATVKETILRIGRAADIDPRDVRNLIISEKIPQLSNLEHLEAVERLIEEYALELLAIDPAYFALSDIGSDAGNLFLFGRALRGAAELCQRRGVALLLCHHTKRGSGLNGQPPELVDASWAGFGEHCRQWVLVNRREPYVPGTGEHRLWLSIGGSAGHGGLWGLDISEGTPGDPGGRRWEASVLNVPDVKEGATDRRETERESERQQRIDRDRERLLRGLAKFPQGETERTLHAAAGLYGARFRDALAAAIESREVEPCQLTRPCRKAPYDGWRLAQ